MTATARRLSPTVAAQLHEGTPFASLFKHRDVEVEVYRPRGTDQQTPHARDEIYVVISGEGRFVCDGESRAFVPGELIFVPAGAEHRFVDFSDDFATWVIFFGIADAVATGEPA